MIQIIAVFALFFLTAFFRRKAVIFCGHNSNGRIKVRAGIMAEQILTASGNIKNYLVKRPPDPARQS
jgi:hypothetical protein